MNELLQGYIEDFRDNLIRFNEALMEMEQENLGEDIINNIFRVAHTIKGNSAAMEFYKIEKVTHKMEDILQEVRCGKRGLTTNIINVLYECHDFLEDSLVFLENDGTDENADIDKILQLIEGLSEKSHNDICNPVDTPKDEELKVDFNELQKLNPELMDILKDNYTKGLRPYKLDVTISEACMMKGIRAWFVFEKITNLGTLIYSLPECPDEKAFENGDFNVEGNILQIVLVTNNDIDDIVSEIQGISEIEEVKKYEIALEDNCKDETEEGIKENVKGEIKEELKEEVKKPKPKQCGDKQESGFIRIPVSKVDNLMDMLGELLILNSQNEQFITEYFSGNSKMLNNLSRSSKLIKEIQSLSMALKMIEIKPTLHRLHRIARDTAAELNKKVSVVIEGEETEIDRSAVEKLFDPLMHLVRNSVSHGIEDEEERIRAGKKPEGTVYIKAYSKRGNVYIEVSDDGKGIDKDKILKKALSLNLAEEGKEYSEEEIIRFIFKPGFSTQEQVNNISGRGVGMNVVEEVLSRVGGKIEINNKLGEGCTFILKIPMNLAVVNGTIIEVEGGRYIIPTLYIREFFIVHDNDWVIMKGKKRAVRIRDNIIPVMTASKLLFGMENEIPDDTREVIILELEQKLLAFPVDRIIARQEIVSKPLDQEFASIDFVSGAAILGDGKVSLILDVEVMFKMAQA